MNPLLGFIFYSVAAISQGDMAATTANQAITLPAADITSKLNNEPDPLEKFVLKTESSIILKVPYVNQVNDLPEDKKGEIGNTACGPTALNMYLKYLDTTDDSLYETIDKMPYTVYIKGDQFYRLDKGPEVYERTSRKVEFDPKAFYDELKEGRPVIIGVKNYDGFIGHALVVVGITEFDGENAEALIIHDPWTSGYREFKYITKTSLRQPEGYTNYIGNQQPFVIE